MVYENSGQTTEVAILEGLVLEVQLHEPRRMTNCSDLPRTVVLALKWHLRTSTQIVPVLGNKC